MDLFVYGTLLFPEVLTALLGRVPASTPGRAEGWRAAALESRVYPGLVRHRGGTASGLVLGGLTGPERELLDAYEDRGYELTAIALAGGRTCLAYVWCGEVLPADWSAKDFAAVHLSGYARRCGAWRAAPFR